MVMPGPVKVQQAEIIKIPAQQPIVVLIACDDTGFEKLAQHPLQQGIADTLLYPQQIIL